MAAPGDSGASAGGGSTEEAFMTFYSEVKQIEKRDSVLTSKNQIERLTRPGSSYFNLNPFEVSCLMLLWLCDGELWVAAGILTSEHTLNLSYSWN
uniref:Uncharacterized protein n=1 Tax=Ursus americanus TaxID=9643 RepID=A0A452SI79_URSAM